MMNEYQKILKTLAPRLVRLRDIATELEIGPAAVGNWPSRYADYPDPVFVVGVEGTRPTKLYDRRDVEAFLKRHPRLGYAAPEKRLKGTK